MVIVCVQLMQVALVGGLSCLRFACEQELLQMRRRNKQPLLLINFLNKSKALQQRIVDIAIAMFENTHTQKENISHHQYEQH